MKKLKRKEKYRSQETEKKEEGWLYSKYRSQKIEKKGKAWFYIPSVEVKKLKRKKFDFIFQV